MESSNLGNFAFLIKRELILTKARPKTLIMVLLMGSIEAAAVAIVNYGLMIGDAILITPISSALSIVTIILAIIFLKDRVTKLQGLGIMVAIAGIIVAALVNSPPIFLNEKSFMRAPYGARMKLFSEFIPPY